MALRGPGAELFPCRAASPGLRTTPRTAGPHNLTPNTVELISTIGSLLPRGGPVQDPVLTPSVHVESVARAAQFRQVAQPRLDSAAAEWIQRMKTAAVLKDA